MPTFRSGDASAELPFRRYVINSSELSLQMVEHALEYGEASIVLHLDGLPDEKSGYLINVKRQEGNYLIYSISNQPELGLTEVGDVYRYIRHVSGLDFFEDLYELIDKARNDVGSGIKWL